MWKQLAKLKRHHKLAFSMILLSGIVCLWRGIWGLLDLYFFASDPAISYSLSALLGLAILAITHYTIDSIV